MKCPNCSADMHDNGTHYECYSCGYHYRYNISMVFSWLRWF